MLTYQCSEATVLPGEPDAAAKAAVRYYRCPVPEFAVIRVTLSAAHSAWTMPARDGPSIALVVQGAVDASVVGTVKAGTALFVAHQTPLALCVDGEHDAIVFIAVVPNGTD